MKDQGQDQGQSRVERSLEKKRLGLKYIERLGSDQSLSFPPENRGSFANLSPTLERAFERVGECV